MLDVASYPLGWWLMDSQTGMFGGTAPPNPNETVIWVAALLIGVPGIQQLLMLKFGGSIGTGSSPSAPASEEASSPSPS